MLVSAHGDQKRVSHPNFGNARIQTQEQQVLFTTEPSISPAPKGYDLRHASKWMTVPSLYMLFFSFRYIQLG